jgi:16S rRNA (cytosine967-C5)-methyltransferase
VSARSVAFDLLVAVEIEGAYANLALPKLLEESRLETRDTAFAQQLAFGVIRNQYFLDRVIESAADREVVSIDRKALILLRMGAQQLLEMRVPDHAALSETVNLAKHHVNDGVIGFINAVLRKISKHDRESWLATLTAAAADDYEKLAIQYSHPIWIIRALRQALESRGQADELAKLLEIDNQPPLVSLVALPDLATTEDLQDIGATLGPASPIGAEIRSTNPASIDQVRQGSIRVQDQGSQLAAMALVAVRDSSDEETWLDLCAGPGGKTALLAAYARRMDATLVSNEILEHRAKLVSQAVKAVDSEHKVLIGDGRDFGNKHKGKFDRILLDAPCTGLGSLRRRPEARWRKKPSDLQDLTKLQRELFSSAWVALAPGGIIAYVTCSPHQAETTAQIAWAERTFGTEFELLNANRVLNEISPGLRLNESFKTAQLWPHLHETDAMFIALATKSVG